jgi:hypothetical protein
LTKKSVLEEVGWFNEERKLQNVEDSHLWLKMLFKDLSLKSTSDILAYYRVHDAQSTSNNFKNKLKEINLIADFLQKKNSIDAFIQQEINNKYLSLVHLKLTKEEKTDYFNHYCGNYRVTDKPLLKMMLFCTSQRLNSMYYRYIHRKFFAKFKS